MRGGSSSSSGGDFCRFRTLNVDTTFEVGTVFNHDALGLDIADELALLQDQVPPFPSIQAIATLDRFVRLHPASSALDYALYLKGLVNFNDNAGFFSKLSDQDPAERDPQTLRDSFDSFRELLSRYPDSEYAEDAKIRMQFLVNTLARSEVAIASYYLRRKAYIAAISRANNVLKDFPKTRQTRDALQIMVLAYNAMGQNDLRDDAQRVLDLNIAKDENKPALVR